ncbi:hypothetical protein F2Q68_00007040 [Brassica cretica]|uniref:Uncharacterized protein n=1 Tax=Brassica cretica TaxID=69181 RepID=A0A8S9L0Q3_BRACR|nr:hypothetical protein F2Q68_00007040 [Brassica cretica]
MRREAIFSLPQVRFFSAVPPSLSSGGRQWVFSRRSATPNFFSYPIPLRVVLRAPLFLLAPLALVLVGLWPDSVTKTMFGCVPSVSGERARFATGAYSPPAFRLLCFPLSPPSAANLELPRLIPMVEFSITLWDTCFQGELCLFLCFMPSFKAPTRLTLCSFMVSAASCVSRGRFWSLLYRLRLIVTRASVCAALLWRSFCLPVEISRLVGRGPPPAKLRGVSQTLPSMPARSHFGEFSTDFPGYSLVSARSALKRELHCCSI